MLRTKTLITLMLMTFLSFNTAACIYWEEADVQASGEGSDPYSPSSLTFEVEDEAEIHLSLGAGIDYLETSFTLRPIFEEIVSTDCENCVRKYPLGRVEPQSLVIEFSQGDELIRRLSTNSRGFKARDVEAHESPELDNAAEWTTMQHDPYTWYTWEEDRSMPLEDGVPLDGYLELEYTFDGKARTFVAEFTYIYQESLVHISIIDLLLLPLTV